MLRKLSTRIQSEESGFTLIELLVVILIIGILAAIALPAFLGQQTKAQDAAGKSNARNTVSQVESCYSTEQTYANCTTAVQLGTTGNAIENSSATPGSGQVYIAGAANTYTVVGGTQSNDFTIIKDATGNTTRTCANASGTKGVGACPQSGDW